METVKNDMFERMADEVFTAAKCDKSKSPEAKKAWQEVRDILNSKMATLSVTMGLSIKRVDIFEEQKQALIDDLKQMKSERPELL